MAARGSFSPRYCAKPRTNKEKGQRMRWSCKAITDFLTKHVEFLSSKSLAVCTFVCLFVCTGTGGDLVGKEKEGPVNKKFVPAASSSLPQRSHVATNAL